MPLDGSPAACLEADSGMRLSGLYRENWSIPSVAEYIDGARYELEELNREPSLIGIMTLVLKLNGSCDRSISCYPLYLIFLLLTPYSSVYMEAAPLFSMVTYLSQSSFHLFPSVFSNFIYLFIYLFILDLGILILLTISRRTQKYLEQA